MQFTIVILKTICYNDLLVRKNRIGELLLGLDTLKRYRYWYGYHFKKILYCTIIFLKGTLNDTKLCKVIIIQDLKHDYS